MSWAWLEQDTRHQSHRAYCKRVVGDRLAVPRSCWLHHSPARAEDQPLPVFAHIPATPKAAPTAGQSAEDEADILPSSHGTSKHPPQNSRALSLSLIKQPVERLHMTNPMQAPVKGVLQLVRWSSKSWRLTCKMGSPLIANQAYFTHTMTWITSFSLLQAY